jgi:hypothetical protein
MATKLQVFRFIHHTHAPAADLAEEAVVGDGPHGLGRSSHWRECYGEAGRGSTSTNRVSLRSMPSRVRNLYPPFVIFATCELRDILFTCNFIWPNDSMSFLTNVLSSMPFHWSVTLIISALGIVAICVRACESAAVRSKRAEQNKKKELRSLAQRISSYGQGVHQRYPSGDVIVSEGDLAQEFRKRPDVVITALNLLLNEQKVQKVSLRGYWKLNV